LELRRPNSDLDLGDPFGITNGHSVKIAGRGSIWRGHETSPFFQRLFSHNPLTKLDSATLQVPPEKNAIIEVTAHDVPANLQAGKLGQQSVSARGLTETGGIPADEPVATPKGSLPMPNPQAAQQAVAYDPIQSLSPLRTIENSPLLMRAPAHLDATVSARTLILCPPLKLPSLIPLTALDKAFQSIGKGWNFVSYAPHLGMDSNR
jgi:hypothetical protein